MTLAWVADADGNRSDTNKWPGGIVADGAGSTADFSTLNITANRTGILDGGWTIGIVQFRDTSQSQLWTLSGSSTLTLDNGTNAPKARAMAQTSYFNVILAGTNGVAAPDQVGTAVFGAANVPTPARPRCTGAIYRSAIPTPHRRSAQYRRAGEKQVPICLKLSHPCSTVEK